MDGRVTLFGNLIDPQQIIFTTVRLLSVQAWDAPAYNENMLCFPRGFAQIESPIYRGLLWRVKIESEVPLYVVRISGWTGGPCLYGYGAGEMYVNLDIDNEDLSPTLFVVPLSRYGNNNTLEALLLQRCSEPNPGPLAQEVALFRRVRIATHHPKLNSLSNDYVKFSGKKMRMKEHFENRRIETNGEQTHHLYTFTIV